MIGNISKGSNIYGLLEYNYKKIGEGEAIFLSSNLYSSSQDDQEMLYRQTQSLYTGSRFKLNSFHASLSFAPGEKLDTETKISIAEKYLEDMGYVNTPYTVFEHLDTDHEHVHIVCSRIDFEGNTFKSTLDKNRNKEVCKQIEKEFGLIVAEKTTKVEREHKKLSEINAQQYAISNALRKEVFCESSVLFSEGEKQGLQKFFKKKQPKDQELKELLGTNFFKYKSLLENEDKIQYSEKYKLIQRIKQATKGIKDYSAYVDALNKKGIYVRELQKNTTRYLEYGLSEKGYYITEQYLPKEYRYSFLNSGQQINRGREVVEKDPVSSQIQFMRNTILKMIESDTNLISLKSNLASKNIEMKVVYTNQGSQIQGLSFRSTHEGVTTPWTSGGSLDRKLTWGNIESRLNMSNLKDQKSNEFSSSNPDKEINLKKVIQKPAKSNKIPNFNTGKNDSSHKTEQEKEAEKRRREQGL